MKKILYIVIAVVVILVAVLLIKKVSGPEEGAARFSGTISSFDNSCIFDGVCSVVVDDKNIVLIAGGLAMEPNAQVGKLKGVASIGDLESKIGSEAKVYAKKILDDQYTLYGNSEYYVEVK